MRKSTQLASIALFAVIFEHAGLVDYDGPVVTMLVCSAFICGAIEDQKNG